MGSREGAEKSAATKTGCRSVAEWRAKREAGQLWCFRCEQWLPADNFASDGRMSDPMEIPAFLRRNPTGEIMTAHTPAPPAAPATPAKAAKKRRADAYVARLTISIPLDMTNADSLANAIKAVAAIKGTLPEGSTCESTATLGKMDAK